MLGVELNPPNVVGWKDTALSLCMHSMSLWADQGKLGKKKSSTERDDLLCLAR